MLIIPAIDLMGGNVVRLEKGIKDRRIVYDGNPVSVARDFDGCGVKRIHVVDLDAAFGTGNNRKVVKEICSVVNAEVEVGGGIRSCKDVEELLNSGVSRVIIGTMALKDEIEFHRVLELFGEHVIVGVDVKDGIVRVSGWVEKSGVSHIDFLRSMESAGVKEAIVTNIDRDGMLNGVDVSFYEDVTRRVNIGIIASGGVSSDSDVDSLYSNSGVLGVVVGKAIYEGTINLRELVVRYG